MAGDKPGRRRASGQRLTLVILVLVSLTILTLDFRGTTAGAVGHAKRIAHDVMNPLSGALDAAVRPLGDYLEGIFQAGSLSTENARLRAQNARLRQEVLTSGDDRKRLQRLLAAENLPYAGNIPKVVAEVTSGSASDFESTVTLDKGTEAGVAAGMPVVGGGGLVGSVIDAWATGSTVRLVTDPRSSVGVRLGPGGAVAVAVGTGTTSSLKVDYVAPGTRLANGTLLVTSGLQGSVYPPGIPVGTLTRVTSGTFGAGGAGIAARPVVAVSGLDYVDVLQWQESSGL